jgi:pimeloyl-ACP methyl ester carboxylesterase
MPHDDIRYAKNGDVHIAYEVLGSGGGVDVLCIRTFVSQLEHYGRLPIMVDFTDRLARLGRLICFDHRGTGLSDRLRGYRLPTIEERVDDLQVVLDAAGCERAVLIALADGGPLGCMFAAAHPERTAALILCNTRPRIAWAPDYPWGTREGEFEQEMADIDREWGMRSMAEASTRRSPFEGMSYDEQVDWYLEYMRVSAGPGDAAAAYRMFYESDVRHVLGTIRVPTLVLSRGGQQADEALAFARLIPGARHEALPGTAMYVIAEHGEAYLEKIEKFVRILRDEEAELESILATVLFTDIVGSTERQTELGDRRWADLVGAHHQVVRGCLARYRGPARYGRRGLLRRLRRPGARDTVRTSDRQRRAGTRPRSPRRAAHRGVSDDRRQARWARSLNRRPYRRRRRAVRDSRVADGEGLDRRLRA